MDVVTTAGSGATSTQPRLRSDLVIHPDAETGRGRVVKDPRSRRYFRFDEMESFVLERLDGVHTPVDIQVELASELGEALSLDEIYDFIDTLVEKGLVESDRPCLPVLEPALGRQVVEALQQGGFRFRTADQPPPPGVAPTRRNMAEAREFDAAVALLAEGRFQAALRAFDEILAANPGNQRAAAIRQILLQAGRVRQLEAGKQQASGPKNSPFYYRIPLFDPDALFTRLEPLLRPIWTRTFLVFYGALVALAGWVALTDWAELSASLPRLSLTGWAGGLIVAVVFLTAMHEFAHGLTCKHFGGKVPELGFLLIFFFMPALYVDVSDAWLFRHRRQRALVGLAGPMFDLAVACSALLAWRVLPPGHLGMACMLIMVSSGGSVLLNMNPLMRLDGYYVLSDLSGIPNLRKTALAAAGRWLASLRGRPSPVTLTLQARIFLGVYGTLSAIYIAFILFVLLRTLTSMSIALAGIWGPAAVGASLVMLLRRPLRALGVALVGRLRKMTLARVVKIGTALALLGVLTAVPWPLRVRGTGEVRARLQVAVRPEVSGNIAEILVREGERVEAGQVVARLDRSELLAQLAMTRSDIERARADLGLLIDGPQREQVRQVWEKVRAAQAEVAHLASRHERLERLRAEGLVSADLYEQVSKELAVSRGSLRAATEEARMVEKGARPERIAAAQAEVSRLETKAANVMRRLAACDLRAPIDGIVVTPGLEARAGERIASGGDLLEIADTDDLVVDVSVLESEIGDVEPGQTLELRLAAYPGRTFLGTVVEIAPVASVDDLGRAHFRVRCTIDSEQDLLRPGMTGAAKIDCGRLSIARLVLRRVLRLIEPSLL
ncbi:MAG: efflux RND transporter periplasmic adaptor subunit [Acidobacteriota bacterium]|nr:efflux RND transporter periplasmic adaptor subunit [Acidobacteriota bacterium]